MAKKKNKIGWIISGIVLALVVLFIILLQSASFLRINFDSYGHGLVSANGFTSFLQSLRILSRVDYVDDTTGEEFCFNDICWIEAEIAYEECASEEPDIAEFGLGLSHFIIVGPLVEEDYSECEEAYSDTLFEDCAINCEGEIYTWDETPVTDLGEFASTAFPNFVERAQLICSDWFLGGTWISTANKVGCVDAGWIYCDSRSIASAGEVCETIGKTWTCSDEEAFCEG